jgi:hypothetical protein
VRPFFRPAGVPVWDGGPFLVELDDPGDEDRHVFCCKPDTALCGARIYPEEIQLVLDEDQDDEDDDAVLCEACRWREKHDRRSCGAWFCRVRRWWRSR